MNKQVDMQPSLDRLEWLVVRLALRETTRLPIEPGSVRAGLQRVWATLTGLAPINNLANPRLEMLRRFVVATRCRGKAADRYVADLVSLGFARTDLDAIALLAV